MNSLQPLILQKKLFPAQESKFEQKKNLIKMQAAVFKEGKPRKE